MAVTSWGSASRLSGHVLVVHWIVGPSEVDLVETSLFHASSQGIETGILILDNETVFHLN
jgi:hypothetical protein